MDNAVEIEIDIDLELSLSEDEDDYQFFECDDNYSCFSSFDLIDFSTSSKTFDIGNNSTSDFKSGFGDM